MADGGDDESKTAEPTEKRLRDALDKGDVPTSREIPVAVSLVVISLSIVFFSIDLAKGLSDTLAFCLDQSSQITLADGSDAVAIFLLAIKPAAQTFLTLTLLLAASSILASVVQNVPQILPSRIAPDFSRISPAQGLKRILGPQGAFELLKGISKIVVCGLAGFIALHGSLSGLFGAAFLDPDALPGAMLHHISKLTFYTAAGISLLAMLDAVWVRRTWIKKLRMSPQEIKNEAKDSEGDPALKARIRRIARSRIRARMMANVPKATLVVVNPTHYAIALRYLREEQGAPKVLAKGKDLIAAQIRAIAEQYGIPVYEDKSLARSLHDSVEVDQTIPSEFYKAVAEIVIYIMRRSKPVPRRR